MKKLLGLLLPGLCLIVLAPEVAKGQAGAMNTHTLYDTVFRIDTVDLRVMSKILGKLLDGHKSGKALVAIRESVDIAVERLTRDRNSLIAIFDSIIPKKDSVYLELSNYLESLDLGIGFFRNIVDRADTFIRYADINEFLLIRSKIMEAELHLLGSINAYEIEKKEDDNTALMVKQYQEVDSGLAVIEGLLRRKWPPPPEYDTTLCAGSLQISRAYGLSGVYVFANKWAVGAGIFFYSRTGNANHDASLGKSSWGASLSGGWSEGNWLLQPGVVTPDFNRYSWEMQVSYRRGNLGIGAGYSPLLGAAVQFSFWHQRVKSKGRP